MFRLKAVGTPTMSTTVDLPLEKGPRDGGDVCQKEKLWGMKVRVKRIEKEKEKELE